MPAGVIMTAKFAEGAALSSAIKDIAAGNDVRCAVAFWGGGSDGLFSADRALKHRIVCDVTLGGTSADALRQFGAPNNKLLRHVPSLHAKVYLSDRGAVVGSANASQNGIGFEAAPGLIEAGIVLGPDCSAYADAAAWFEAIWSPAERVDDAALAIAAARFRPNRSFGKDTAQPGSLLSMVANDPARFDGISFVLVNIQSTPDEREQSRAAVAAIHQDHSEEINGLPGSGMFIGWSRRDLNRWSRTFVELWMPKGTLSAYGRLTSFFDEATGTVMSSRANWQAVREIVGSDLPKPAEIRVADQDCARRLLAKHGSKFFRATELAAAIKELNE
jgi:hypothetical protein